jgi:myo-inositol 2-dehydrogenase / D-chiro-inositol 1-dehydrogenase
MPHSADPKRSPDALRLGIIGCGQATMGSHLPALAHLSEIEVVALADVDPVSLRSAAQLVGVERCYPDHRTLLDQPDLEAVAVCVPAPFHAEVAQSVLDAGKHLFLEKPLAMTLEEAARLIRSARASKRKSMLGFNLRWHRLTQRARATIQHGALGPAQMIATRLTSYHDTIPPWRERRASGGGVLFEQAVHHFDLWSFLMGSAIEEISATTRSGKWEDEYASVTASLASGILASGLFAVHTGKTNAVEVFCRDGSLSYSFYRFDSLRCSRGEAPTDGIRPRLEETVQALGEAPEGFWRLRKGGDFIASFQSEWRHFYAAIRNDSSVECSFEDGRRALLAVLAAVKSAAVGRPVKLAEISESN